MWPTAMRVHVCAFVRPKSIVLGGLSSPRHESKQAVEQAKKSENDRVRD